MKIFVINLEKSREKKDKITSLLNNYTADYEFFKATNGTELKNNEYNINLEWYNPCDNTHITLGEIGCAISHYTLWKKIIDENIESAIIFEDDIEIINNDFLNICEKINPSQYDLIYLSRKKILDIHETSASEIYSELIKPSFSYWCCAYMLSNSGAKKLYQENYINNIIPVDEYVPYISCVSNHYNPKSQNILDKYFLNIKNNMVDNFNCYAFENNLVKPNSNAFNNSSTFHSPTCESFRNDITCITVGTDYNDCCKRYVKSCKKYGINPIILGLGEKWMGGNMAEGPGGGHKINLLKNFLDNMNDNKLIVFTDCYDVIMNNNINILIEKYKRLFNGKIVFAGETSCWPDKNLELRYPYSTKNILTRFLNSGVFIGYSNDIKNILMTEIINNNDDQLYYTYKFFEHENIVIDYNCELFLCLNGLTEKIHIDKEKSCILYNNNRPTFIHGNGPENIKIFFNNIISNYCCGYNSIYGYKNINKKSYSKILIVLKEENNFNNFNKWFNGIKDLNYDKNLISILFVYNTNISLNSFQNNIEINDYNYIKTIKSNEYNIWNNIFNDIENIDFEYLFFSKSNSIINNPNTLLDLLSQEKKIIAPLLIKNNCFFSNFWGDVDHNGFYKTSNNYFDIIKYNEIGCWNVPYIAETLLIHKNYINKYNFTNIKYNIDDPDLIFCYNIRDNFNFMYILNTQKYGYIDDENTNLDNNNITLNSIINNRREWENKYLNSNFNIDNITSIHKDLGNDIHFLQLFSPIFCKEIIEIAESNGSWSRGGESYYDNRINNIENHPTRDIQLYDINLEEMWKKIIEYYISPFMWNNYKFSTKGQNISFVVKYSLDGQKELNPHHDASSYTVNLCLNNDFSGGGCRFIKQNKIINNKEIGSIIIHPGRVTHYHEGLKIDTGTRFILVSFID